MEQVVDGVTGYLFSPGNAEECAQNIRTLLSEKNFRDKGRAGRKRTEEAFGEQRLIHATDSLYRELLQSKRRLRDLNLQTVFKEEGVDYEKVI